MLILHKVIDGLRGLKKYHVLPVPGVTPAMRAELASRLVPAEKFDFGRPPLEPDTAKPGNWILPKLSDDEVSWWREGLIPLPAPSCWFELQLGATRTGFLVTDVGDAWNVERVDLTTDGLLCDGVVRRAFLSLGSDITVEVTGNVKALRFYKKMALPEVTPEQQAADVHLVIYLALMLNSRTTEKHVERVSRSPLSASRLRKGRAPLSDHLIVRIVPERFAANGGGPGRPHRSPRLHWRRSHLRHYDHATPASKWSGSVEHDGRRGWHVAVIARQLVGREDLGEVSHDYWVPIGGGK